MLGQAGRPAALDYMIELMKLCQHDFEVQETMMLYVLKYMCFHFLNSNLNLE